MQVDDSEACGTLTRATSPYGDGHARERIAEVLVWRKNGKKQKGTQKRMMVERLLKLAGRGGMKIDPGVSTGYLFRVCLRYALMALRGGICSLFHISFAHDIFIGANVKLIETNHIALGHKVRLEKGVKIDALSSDGVALGNGVVLGQNTLIECTGSLHTLGKGVKIGSRSTFGSNCFFGAAGGITIGEDVMAGQYIRFHAENHDYGDINVPIRRQGVSHKGIVIGNNCWIGAGVVFLDGAKLGDGCVVAANAVVRGVFPDNSVIGGVPAKILKMRC